MTDIDSLQETPRTVRILNAARDEIRGRFERYRETNIDNWEPPPMPDGWVPPRRSIGR